MTLLCSLSGTCIHVSICSVSTQPSGVSALTYLLFFVIKQKNMQNAANFKKPLHLCCHGFPCFECETFLHVLHGKQYDKQVQGGSVLIIEPGTLCVSQKPKKRCVCSFEGRKNKILCTKSLFFIKNPAAFFTMYPNFFSPAAPHVARPGLGPLLEFRGGGSRYSGSRIVVQFNPAK